MTTDQRGRAMAARMGLAPIGSRRIEVMLASMVSVFGVLFTSLTLPRFVSDLSVMHPALGPMVAVAVYGLVAMAALAALLHQWTRPVFVVAGIVYLAALGLWPLIALHGYAGPSTPWLFQLAGVACAFVVVAARWHVALTYVLGVSVAIGFLRTTPAGGGVGVGTAVLDASYASEIGIALLLVVLATRRAAKRVDSAQGAALTRYADSQIDEATEAERTRTDALVHDRVLTTFLSAAAAQTPEARALATRMAADTMNVLSRATVASQTGPRVPVADLLDRVRTEAGGIGEGFDYSVRDVRDHFVPENVADAIVSAAVQAMSNSVKHAGGPDVPRSVVVKGAANGAVCVHVRDEGRGFDPKKIASERLGVRVSIYERMSRVNGAVELRTAIGEGTEFVLSWPDSATGASEAVDQPTAVLA
jgi:signal transduction histidine kinase